MTENIIVAKTYSFAVKIVRFCFEIQDERREYVLSHQLLKSGTSIGDINLNIKNCKEK